MNADRHRLQILHGCHVQENDSQVTKSGIRTDR
ncbi:hypothetical protein M3J09_011637 [Ascochyta lentis]